MSNEIIYVKIERSVQAKSEEVFVKDIGKVHCEDPSVQAKCRAAKIYHFSKPQTRCVIDSLQVVELLEKICPGCSVQLIGERDVLVEYVPAEQSSHKGDLLKTALVCMIAFFGPAFSVMAYHNDVGIHNVFNEVYRMFMGREAQGVTVLEVSYSIGLAVGITLFFNHVGGKRLTADPTPIEVSMRNYEEDVDKALIEAASRKEEEI